MWLNKAIHFLTEVVSLVSKKINTVGMGVLVVMMLLTTTDVFLRYLFNRPIKGAYELTEFMMIILVFFGLAHTASVKRHIALDVVASRLPQQARMVMGDITYFLSLALSSMMTWRSIVQAKVLWSANQTSGSLYIPVFPFMLVVAVGYGVLSVVLLAQLLDCLTQTTSASWRVKSSLILGGLIGLVLLSTPVWLAQPSGVIAVFGISLFVLFLVAKVPIGFALGLAGFLGFAYLRGLVPGLNVLGLVPYSTIASVSMSVIPLFILMGQFVFYAGISQELYNTAYKWVGYLRGGLAMATVGACGAFAACTGSSVAGAVTMGKVALPEMKRYKYDDGLSTGCIAAGGTIGSLIPPSIAFVAYGIMTEQSIGKLFIAGIIPGILEVLFYMVTIHILCKRNPLKGPPGPKVSFIEKMTSLKDTGSVLVLFVLVMGGIYLGIFTPTEAGAVGAFGALIIALSRRKLNRQIFADSLLETGQIGSMIFAIFIGGFIFGYFLTATKIPMELAGLIAGFSLNRYVILGAIFILYLLLGCILNVAAMIVITLPIIFPLVMNLGFDPIWFGVFVVRVGEIAMITPPVGGNVFALKGVAKDIPIEKIFRGVVPFLIADICHVALLVAVPQIATFLPNLMK